jgi:ribonuclease R
MAKAEYSDIPSGHFGLSIDNYCHFTSPIRRLSDLVTHRIITKVLLDGKAAEKYRGAAKRAAAAANEGELRAIGAERRIDNLYKTIYMSDRLGEEFIGKVSSVTSFGLFVTLPNTCEGLVPISEMGGVYVFDEKNLAIRGGKDVFRIGDEVRVIPVEADITRGKVRFELAR